MLYNREPKAVLRITTAGSVDDGKSTLIGRLLYESSAIYEDQLASLQEKKSRSGTRDGSSTIDLALVTDGLKSEREQGITIDVAYKYFASSERKFILADAPGHVQYTRNMVTAASRADVAIILVDAAQGVLEQTRRHAYLLHLLGVPQIVLAINKIDSIGYDEVRIAAIEADFLSLSWQRDSRAALSVIPMSALLGCNVLKRSPNTPWYRGPSLLELLNTLNPRRLSSSAFQLPLQYVGRDAHGRRFAAGTLQKGTIHRGDRVRLLPSQRESEIAALWVHGVATDRADAASAVAIELSDELDLERGNILVPRELKLQPTRRFSAQLVWFDNEPWRAQERYILKMGTQSSRAQIVEIEYRYDLEKLEELPASVLQMNDIAKVQVQSARPLFAESYAEDREAGAFILIDPQTNRTVAAGMTEDRLDAAASLADSPLSRLQLVDSLDRSKALLSGQLLQIPQSFLEINTDTAQLHALGLLLELGWSLQVEHSQEARKLQQGLAGLGYGSFDQGSGI